MIKFVTVLDGDLEEAAWVLYRDCFTPLITRAAQRHMMTHAEFADCMTDERIEKMLLLDDAGVLIGLGTITNELDAVTLIEPGFYQHRWPNCYAAKKIWYVPFLAISNGNPTALPELVSEVYKVAHGGLVAVDTCRANGRFANALTAMTTRLSDGHSVSDDVDAQVTWVHDLTGQAS